MLVTSLVGCFGVPRCHETAGNKEKQGEKTKKLRKKKPKMQQKPPRFCGGFCWAIFDNKIGDFLRFWPFFAHQSRLQLYIYTYICCGVIIWAKFGLLRCYYLGQVCFYKTLFVKKNYKTRFQHLKKLRAQIWGVIIWAKLAILKLQSTWPR